MTSSDRFDDRPRNLAFDSVRVGDLAHQICCGRPRTRRTQGGMAWRMSIRGDHYRNLPYVPKSPEFKGGLVSEDSRFLASGTCFGAVLPLEIAVLRVRKLKFFWPPKAAENFAHL